MKYGLPDQAVNQICAVLVQYPQVDRAVLYGSRAKGNFKPGSDIDLTLCGSDLTPQLCATIAQALDDLLLPYSIDLSVFALLNHPELESHIRRVGVVFFERMPSG
jgi:predicted nucleotidyltransferase